MAGKLDGLDLGRRVRLSGRTPAGTEFDVVGRVHDYVIECPAAAQPFWRFLLDGITLEAYGDDVTVLPADG